MTRLSHSGAEKYNQCGYKYYLHYKMKYRSHTLSSALCFGNALDVALNAMLSGDRNYHDVFSSEWDKYKDSKIDYYKSDLDAQLLSTEELQLPLHEQNYISMGRKGRHLLDAYASHILPRIKKVISIQDEMTIIGYDDEGQPTDDSIYGKLDLIAMIEDDAGVVHTALLDNKTTSEPYAKTSVRKKDQLALYANGYPDINMFGFLTLNKKNFSTQVILDTIPEEKKEEVLTKFVDTLEKIKDEQFDKNKKSCYAFGKRCPFYSHCHQGYFSEDIYKEED